MNVNCLELCLFESSKRSVYDNCMPLPMLYLSWSLATIPRGDKPKEMSLYAHGFSGLTLSEGERLGWGLMLYFEV